MYCTHSSHSTGSRARKYPSELHIRVLRTTAGAGDEKQSLRILLKD